MTITEDIVIWTKTRPRWQQRLLQTLASGKLPSDELLEQSADEILQPPAGGAKSFEARGVEQTRDSVFPRVLWAAPDDRRSAQPFGSGVAGASY